MPSNTKKQMFIFKIGEESFPKVLNGFDYIDSPFAEAIDKGIKLVMERLKNVPINNNHEQSSSKCQTPLFANNVISFLGDRGSGKTSTMLSVVQVLKGKTKECGDGHLMDDIEEFNIIDPSFFDEHHNILQIFLGEFYRNFKELTGSFCQKSNEERDKLRKLQSEFKSVRDSITYIDPRKPFDPLDELDELAHLSSGVNLARSIGMLVNKYLDYVNKKSLLLVIDDIDLNISSSYEMMEQIRKYLCLPNVIILLGAKLGQLKMGVVQYLRKYKLNDITPKSAIEEMADRYLVKFLPLSQRIIMPQIGDLMRTPLRIKLSETEVIEGNTVDDTVLSLIFKKTRFLFYNYADESSLIIPRNLRSLRMLTSMIAQMDDPDIENPSIHISNKTTFKNYIVEEWIPANIPEYSDFALSLLNEANVTLLNKRVVEFILSNSPNLEKWAEIDDDGVNPYNDSVLSRIRLMEVVNPANTNANVSVGDVALAMRLSKEFEDNDRLKYLFFFINTFYSIKLYELYDEMTSSETLGTDGFKQKNDTPTTIPELKKDTGIDVPDYIKLTGGSFFTLTGDSFIPLSPIESSREINLIDAKALGDEIKKFVDDFSKAKSGARKKNVNKLRLLEFFVLCSVRNPSLKKGRESFQWNAPDTFRTDIDVKYYSQFGNNVKNVIFSPTAPFFTMIYPKWAYDRYNDKLYDIAAQCEGSILYQLLHEDWKRGYDNNLHTLMSAVAIRNMEIRNDLERWLKSRKGQLRPNKNGDIGVLADFYQHFSGVGTNSYTIKTYDKEEKGSYHEITFSPIHLLGETISYLLQTDKKIKGTTEEETRHELRILFDIIYSPSDKLEINRIYSISRFMDSLSAIAHPGVPELKSLMESFAHTSTEDRINSVVLVRSLSYLPKIIEKDLMDQLFSQELIKFYANEVIAKKEREGAMKAEQINDIENDISQVRKEKTKYEKERSTIVKELENTQKDLNTLSEKRTQIGLKLSKVFADKNDLEERGKALSNNITQIQKQLDQVSVSQKIQEEVQAGNNAKRKNLTQILNEVKNDGERERLESEKRELEEEAYYLDKDIEELRGKRKTLISQKDVYTESLEDIHGQMTQHLSTIVSFKGDLKIIDLKAKEKNAVLENLNIEMDGLERSIIQNEDRINSLEKRKNVLSGELAAAKKDLTITTNQLKRYL